MKFPKALFVKWVTSDRNDPWMETSAKSSNLAPSAGEPAEPIAEYHLVGTAEIESRPVVSKAKKVRP